MSNQLELSNLLKELPLSIDNSQIDQLVDYIKLLIIANQTTNLTAITDFNEALVKHLYDSLLIMAVPEFTSAQSIIDVGSGGGLPSIPLAICNPDKKIISLDATQKKINFQIAATQQLKIPNIIPVWGRAEEVGKQNNHREQYDLAIARAVAPLNVLAELTIPFVKLNGNAIFYKGREAETEISQGEHAVKALGAEIIGTKLFALPANYGSRVLVVLKKTKSTSLTYPRKPGTPQKRPL